MLVHKRLFIGHESKVCNAAKAAVVLTIATVCTRLRADDRQRLLPGNEASSPKKLPTPFAIKNLSHWNGPLCLAGTL